MAWYAVRGMEPSSPRIQGIARTLQLVASGLLAVAGVGLAVGAFHPSREPYVSRFTEADHQQALAELRAARRPYERYDALVEAAKTTVWFGSLEQARSMAEELLDLAGRLPRTWNYGNALHDGHLVLGQVALRQGDVERAKAELLASGDTPGSPQLDSFGPNLGLARELLERGEKDAVLAYFERIRRFWTSERGRLDTWASDVKAGRMPDFGANLVL